MLIAPSPSKTQGIALALGWRRLLATLVFATLIGLLNSVASQSPTSLVVGRALLVGFVALLGFGLFEQWPARLPGWIARWVLQLVAVVVAMPLAALLAYFITTGNSFAFLLHDMKRTGFVMLSVTGMLFGPWIALTAMLRQREAFARGQALAFELERSELERRALDARMRLLQSQVQPHFLFNTLANVQALVDAGSPQASAVLRALVAYLRAAVPRLNEPLTTLGEELQLVRAYLDLMHMRMPDRLQYAVDAEDAALDLRCPPLTLLTLVENAVRHGIDPSEEGGRIEIDVRLLNQRCQVRVCDTGVGLQAAGNGLGTGLANLRERLQQAFSGNAQLRLSSLEPHGICVELDFPAERIIK
ncbi:sensor histidine kinase [Massilia glaciei]|uniref:Sensor histidine kinase n=1 Tax=Massilia glaciei TaxID=1524097 RepID=A0A2U2HH56_9BURK|nr:histidine kinase [Massilia glaciei]PWF44992.1 sensor histidine kinase [Massilia glaciei]